MRKSQRFTELRSGQVWEPPVLTSLPCPHYQARRPRAKKGLICSHQVWRGVPEGGLFSFLLFQKATSGLMRLPWVHRAWELLGPDVVCLRESCTSGAEPLACGPGSLTSASCSFAPSLPFSGVPSSLTCPLLTSCTVCRGSGTFFALPRDRQGLLRKPAGL